MTPAEQQEIARLRREIDERRKAIRKIQSRIRMRRLRERKPA